MKIVLFGATGHVGQALVNESLQRGHDVTAIVRDLSRLTGAYPKLDVVAGNISKPTTYTDTLRHADAVIASISGRRDNDMGSVARNAAILLETAAKAGVSRLAWVGGAASLLSKPGVRVIDDANFPEALKAEAQAQIGALETFRKSNAKIDWIYVSPSKMLEDGERTGNYRIGGDELLVDATGKSHVSIPDLAAALLDRVEQNDRPRQRVTVGY